MTCFANVTITIAGKSKFIYQERFQIAEIGSFNIDCIKIKFNAKLLKVLIL